MDRNEIKWVSGAIAGDTDAFGMLVATHSPWLFARIASRLRSREVAEDLLQDALLAAFERLGELRDPSSFGPWLCSIVDNKVRMWHRRRIVQLSWLERLGAEPAAQIDREETRLGVVVREALARLTQAHRDVVVHYYLKGYTYQQTADLLEVGTDVVRSRLQKARRRLAKEMEEMAEPSSVHTYDLGVEDLEGLRCAAAFASVDPSREILRAICLDAGGRIIATDGSRLLDWMSPGLASLAAPAILAEVRADAIPDTDRATLLLGEEEATIKSPEGSGATFPLIPGPYVPYEKAVGTPGPIEVIAGSEELMSCVDEIEPFMASRHGLEGTSGWNYTPRVELHVSGLERKLSLRTSRDYGYARVEDEAADLTLSGPDWDSSVGCAIEVKGLSEEDAPFRAGVNHDFLRSIVAALKSGGARIRMRLDHQRKSGLHFDVGDGARRALLMPMVWLDA